MSRLRLISRAALISSIALGLGLSASGASAQPPGKVEICHKGRTISVSLRAIPGHERHGDTMGECPNPLKEMRALTERLMLSCALGTEGDAGTHVVTAASVSLDITADLADVDLTAVNCPEALVVVNEAGCDELSQSATPEAQTYNFACPSAADDAVVAPADEG